jgi:hypothetical protein
MPKQRSKRLVWIGFGALLTCIVLFFAYAVANDLPGGLADRRMSRVTGVNGTLRIPLGKTPEEAVQKVRHFLTMQVIHKESVDGGVLLFIKRFYQKEGRDLQIEYVRKTWLGWKWVWGGGYGIGGSTTVNAMLNYMVMPKIEGINTPFPMVVGEVLDPSIKNVIIVVDGQSPGVYAAKLAGSEVGHTIWFTFLPQSVSTPFEIEALNSKGDIIARKTTNDPRGFGEISIKKP